MIDYLELAENALRDGLAIEPRDVKLQQALAEFLKEKKEKEKK